MEPFQLMINRSGSDAARNEKKLLLPKLFQRNIHKVGGISERSYHVCKPVAHLKCCHPHRLRANRLENNGNRSLFLVVIANRKGNSLTLSIRAYDQKLTGERALRDSRCHNVHQIDLGSQKLFSCDLKHILMPLSCDYCELLFC